ncbi:MAG: peptide chain release factor N(5)-glutamine methyltransferase [Atopobium sp.]|uniref:peptide chain release factor N(5)-glutamine methyltransferase n=1 Tax=Atopobium sp. TaxID=1872650 RepID=UPI002A757DE8|nr:peptide chain release factor N(5)-glutamine methyltransferase [Atopobium sp.]MDY2788268.1 peptide chain release factor N(5)-glutamine methyltransferase [Atopobium sp.]MDY4522807.1 peptide chain release factor N(5)-glutamine methyltransferase [Atopobium sp.]
MEQTWTIGKVLSWTTGYLERKGDEHPRLSAEWIINAVTGLSRVELYTNFDKPLSTEELGRMHMAVERRGKGEPLQYVTGEMPFRHIVLRCEEGVLIPRPETEVLVDVALEALDAQAKQPSAPYVLEVGTGTGCIALSIASERPGTHVVATDISSRAIALATRNRNALSLESFVDIVACDLVSGVDPELMGTFSVLVSNPPYIPTAVLEHEVPAEVKDHEPHVALDGGADGLDILRRLLEVAPQALCPKGVFCVELHEDSLDDAAALAQAQGVWETIRIVEDLTHRPRILVCTRAA